MEEEGWLKLGVAATLSRLHAADQRQLLEALARMLCEALPAQTKVVRKGGLFARQRPVREVRVHLGDVQYALEDPGHGSLAAHRILIKRGIVLKTEAVPVAEWIPELVDALQAHAEQNQAIAAALKHLLE